jgi:hypothetical protein
MSLTARALRSDVVRRAASRGDAPRRAALPIVMSISPTHPIDQANMAGRKAASRQRCCRSRHLFRIAPKKTGLLDRRTTIAHLLDYYL